VERYPELRGRALSVLLFFSFLWFMNMGARVIFSPILPLLEDEFLVTHARASSIFMFQAIGYGVALVFSGFFAGVLGYKKSIALSLTVSSSLLFLIALVKVFPIFYLLGFVLGLSTGFYLPSALPLITEYFAEKDWGKCISIHDSGAPVSIFGIPLIVMFLLHFFDWRGILAVFGAAFLASAIIFYLTSAEVQVKHSEKTMLGDLIKMPSLWTMEVLFAFGAAANMGIYAITPLYLTKELSLSIEYANTILGLSRLGGVGVAIAAGFIVDRINLKKVMFVLLLATGILTVFMGLASARHVGILLFFQAVFVTGFFPVGLVSIARMFSRETRGMATGLILTFSMIFGVGIISYLLGLSGDLVGFRFGIVILGILVCATSPLSFFLKGLK
jgi:MFS transporter, NNP family, nitrate/nitrite transporter